MNPFLLGGVLVAAGLGTVAVLMRRDSSGTTSGKTTQDTTPTMNQPVTRSSNVSVSNGVLLGPGGFRYTLTEEDRLWLARATWGESGTHAQGNAAIVWAMAQYHALVIGSGGRRPAFSTLTGLLRAYCQPVNPKWATTEGSGCRQQPNLCTPADLERRARFTNASWGQIPSSVRGVVDRFFQGALDNPIPGLVDWNNRDWGADSQVPIINIARNRFGIGRSRRIAS